MGRFLLHLLASVLVLCSLAPSAIGDDFYEQQFRAGKADFQSGRNVEAADEFRIAAFGFLDRPQLLAEALVRLALVQNALGRASELSRTLDRFVDLEQRFAPYGRLQIEPAAQSRFEEILMRIVPQTTLASIPGLARLGNSETQRIAGLPPEQRIAAYEANARREPKNIDWPLALAREAAARDATADVIRWAGRAMEIDPANKEARLLSIHARTGRGECREALALLRDLSPAEVQQRPEIAADQFVCLVAGSRWPEAQAILPRIPEHLRNRPDVARAIQTLAGAASMRTTQPSGNAKPTAPVPTAQADDLVELSRRLLQAGRYQDAVQRLESAVQTEPKNREYRLALLEAAVLAKDFRTAASQLPAVGPLNAGEELYMFYASVAMYETGRRDEAKPLMERARPRMEPSPIVDYYMKAVLGGKS